MNDKDEILKKKHLPGTPFTSKNTAEEFEKICMKKELSKDYNLANEIFNLKEIKNKILKAPCEYVILKGAFLGEINISHKYMTFSSTLKPRSDEQPYKFGALVFT